MKSKQPYRKRSAIVLFAVFGLLVLLGGALLWGFGATANKTDTIEPLIRPVKTMVLSETTVMETRSFPGLVQAASETDLAFRVGGPLIEFDVRIGQRVEKGDIIALIDPRDFEINVMRLSAALGEARAALKAMRVGARAEDIAALEAKLTAARAQMTESERNVERLKKLLADKAISQSQYDQTKAAYDTAKANVDALVQELRKARRGARAEDIEATEAGIQRLSADVKAARNALDDTRLHAPFSGVVSRRHVENYEHVKDGDPILSLLDFSNVEVHTSIPEDLVIRRSSFVGIFCTLDSYPGRRFEAILKEVGRKTDSANQSYPMTVTLRVPEKVIVEPGMAATVTVSLKDPGGGPNTGFFLPPGAVFADTEGHSCVWKIDQQTMSVTRTRVTIGDFREDSIHILSGITAGDQVVTAGARFLRDNQEVRILGKGTGEGS